MNYKNSLLVGMVAASALTSCHHKTTEDILNEKAFKAANQLRIFAFQSQMDITSVKEGDANFIALQAELNRIDESDDIAIYRLDETLSIIENHQNHLSVTAQTQTDIEEKKLSKTVYIPKL